MKTRKARCKLIPSNTPIKEKLQILFNECEINEETGCWNSPRALLREYPSVRHKGKMNRIGRVILISQGIDMRGLDTRHRCHNKLCINPDHLKAGTRKENIIDTAKAFRNGKKLKNEDQIHEIRSLKGVEPSRITCERFGLSDGHVSRIQTGNNYSWLVWHGDNSGKLKKCSVKLKDENQIHEIRSLQGIEIQQNTADRFGISQSEVSRIQSGKVFTWLPWQSSSEQEGLKATSCPIGTK